VPATYVNAFGVPTVVSLSLDTSFLVSQSRYILDGRKLRKYEYLSGKNNAVVSGKKKVINVDKVKLIKRVCDV